MNQFARQSITLDITKENAINNLLSGNYNFTSQDKSLERIILENGVTLYSDPAPQFRSASVIVALAGGSRAEKEEHSGLTHLLEHLLFKRTSALGAREIALAIDEFGSDINAFTDTESLCLYGTVVRERGGELLQFLLGLLFDPKFTEEDLRIEKAVIRQEILESSDDLADLTGQELRRIIWSGDPLGHPVFGTLDTLDSFSRDSVYSFLQQSLQGERLIVAVSGFSEILPVTDSLNSLQLGRGNRLSFSSATASPQIVELKRPSQQTHLALGWSWPSISSGDYLAGLVLSALLGHGSSSLLFQLLREELGLCYDFSLNVDAYPDTAAVVFSSSFEPDNFGDICRALRTALRGLTSQGVDEEDFRRTCRMVVAQLEMEEDSPRGRLWRAVESELAVGRYISTDDIVARLSALTVDDIDRVAKSYLTGDIYACVGGALPRKFGEWLKW